jgi:quercetin dioxygenase-like cupin family protein
MTTHASHAAAIDDSLLAAEPFAVAAGETATIAADGVDVVLFVDDGEATFALGAESHRLARGCGAVVGDGDSAEVRASSDLRGLRMEVRRTGDLHAPLGSGSRVTHPSDDDRDAATGSRSFQILAGPHNGCLCATVFVGYIPPGRAPWHYHLYDEIVYVVGGEGRVHLREAGTTEELRPGSMFRLRPRQVHIVENTSAHEELAVLGIFTPAGSPSAAYLEPHVLAEYAAGG